MGADGGGEESAGEGVHGDLGGCRGPGGGSRVVRRDDALGLLMKSFFLFFLFFLDFSNFRVEISRLSLIPYDAFQLELVYVWQATQASS